MKEKENRKEDKNNERKEREREKLSKTEGR